MKRFLIIALTAAMTFVWSMPIGATEAEATVPHPNAVEVLELEDDTSYTSGEFEYVLNDDGTAKITKCTGTTGELVIPSTIDGIIVTAIGENAIEMHLLGEDKLTIPSTVTYIAEGFLEDRNCGEIVVEEGNTAYKMVGNALMTMDGKTIISVENNSQVEEFVVPAGVTRLAQEAFRKNSYVKKVVISDEVTSIGERVFQSSTVQNCVFGNGIKEISMYAFWGCNKLYSVTFSDSIEEIGDGAFGSCGSLKNIEIGKNVRVIGGDAFKYAGFEKITIPASVETINGSIFGFCDELKEIKVEEESKYYKIVDEALVSINGKNLIAFPPGSLTTEYVVPASVIKIEDGAFLSCVNLREVTIVSNVTSMGDNVFTYCTGLEAIIIPGEITRIEYSCFSQCDNLKTMFLPASLKYIHSTALWRCPALEKVYYVGSANEWANVNLNGADNEQIFANVEMIYLDNLRDFVARMYTKALGRDYDGAGLNTWVLHLIEETHDGAGLAKEFILGQEFALRNLSNEQFVDVLYATFFNREADAAGKQLWVDTLTVGYPREYVLSQFVNLGEFTQLCAEYGITRGVMLPDGSVAAPGLQKFVGRLYMQVLGRDADNDGHYAWTVALATKTVTAQEAAVNFFTSQEYALKNVDSTTFVTDCYRVFMDREADTDGLSFWVTCIEDAGVSREWVISEFAKSDEFKIIAEKYGL